MTACFFIIVHTQVNISIKPYFWGIYPIHKKITIPTSSGFLVSGFIFLQMAIEKRNEFCIRCNKTVKKLIPLGKTMACRLEFQIYQDKLFCLLLLCSYLLLIVKSQEINSTTKMLSCISKIFKQRTSEGA